MSEREKSKRTVWLTQEELSNAKISDDRFMDLVSRRDVDVYKIQLSENDYGEYLFVTLKRRKQEKSRPLTFYGLGYHEHRERWISSVWEFYETHLDLGQTAMRKVEAIEQLLERRLYVVSNVTPTKQSPQAQLYELYADLTDDDAALTELEDLGWPLLGFDK